MQLNYLIHLILDSKSEKMIVKLYTRKVVPGGEKVSQDVIDIMAALEEVKPLMRSRIEEKHGTYGSYTEYDYEKFLVNLAKNYAQFIQAVVYNDKDIAKLKAADMVNVIMMTLKSRRVV